jgi:hypothetical protein
MNIDLFKVGRAVVVVLVFAFLSAMLNVASTYAQHGQGRHYSNVFATHIFEQVDSTTGVVKVITPGIINTSEPLKTQRAYILFTGQAIRFTCDGTAPSTNFGIPVGAGGAIEVIGISDILNFQFINDDDVGTATAHISLQYEKELN